MPGAHTALHVQYAAPAMVQVLLNTLVQLSAAKADAKVAATADNLAGKQCSIATWCRRCNVKKGKITSIASHALVLATVSRTVVYAGP